MTRRRLLILFLPALLIGVLAAALTWLTRSEAGTTWIWHRVAAAVPGNLEASGLRGDLRSGVRLTGVRYRNEGFSLQADQVGFRVDLDFVPPSVSVKALRFGQLDMHSLAKPEDEAGTPVAEWLPQLQLPVPVTFGQVRGDRLSWTSVAADGADAQAPEPAIVIRDLAFAAGWYRRLQLRDLTFSSGESRWRGRFALAFEPPHRLELVVQGVTPVPGVTIPDAPASLSVRASGNLASSRWLLELAEPGIRLTGELSDLLDTPGWDLQLAADRLAWPPGAAEPALVVADLLASSYGNLEDYGLEVEARVGGGDLPAAQVRAVGTGNRNGADFEVLNVAGDDLRADGTSQIAWAPSLEVRSELDVERFDPRRWIDAWGDAEPLSGRLGLRWQPERLSFEISEAEAPGSLASLTGSGSYDAGSGTVSAELDWRGLAWPPGAEEPSVFSEQGQARLDGRLDDWRVQGGLNLSGPDFPAGRLQVDGGGNRESLGLDVPDGAVLGGRLSGRFELDWSDRVHWSAEAQLNNVSTAPLAPAFPGRVSGAVSASGRPAAGPQQPMELQIGLRGLEGIVRGRTFGAEGRLVMEDGRLVAHGLQLHSGDSELTADGHLQGPSGLSFTADIESLGDFLDDAAGRFAGSGTVSLAASEPRLRLQGTGRDLAIGAISAERVELATEGPGARTLRLTAHSLTLNDTPLASLELSATGRRPLEELDFRLRFDESEARLRLEGGVEDWTAPLTSGWQGRLADLRIERPALGFVELQQPAALRIDSTGVRLEEACFKGSREGNLCVFTDWRAGGEHLLDASLENVSPNLAMRLLGSDLALTQRLNGSVRWRQLPSAQPEAQVRLDISAGQVNVAGEDEPVMLTAPGVFSFELVEGGLRSGNLDIPLVGGGGVDVDFDVPDLSEGRNSGVEGSLRVNLDSVEPVLQLVPGIEGSSGPVTADLQVGGTVSDPKLTGHVSLVRGRIAHFATGLALQDIRLAGAVYAYDQTELNGTFRSGEGQGSVRAVVNFHDPLKPELRVELEGQNLTLIEVPDLRVQADPDVRLDWREGRVHIDGRVFVPSARLSPRYLPTPTATESEDVVIVAGDAELLQRPAEEPVKMKIQGDLELELGQDVQLRLDRATARLRGTAKFKWDGELVPVATGSFSVTGEIKAYGQLLQITDGRVNFSGRPADNPVLNIRAKREIYGNTQVTEAGVLVSGPLKHPDLEVYTVPMTTRERALSMLVTGNDFNYEQGVGSVEVGMYVAPKLFISYGIGLFDEQNVISARYDLGKGFGIKTTSGQRETGADISYTIER